MFFVGATRQHDCVASLEIRNFLYIHPHVIQPNIYSWKTFNYGRELHWKDVMLHA